MNKLIKMLTLTYVAISLLLSPISTYADNSTKTITIEEAFKKYDDEMKIKISRAVLEHYLKNYDKDFIGKEGEKIYFYLQNLYAGNNPIKRIEFDLKNTDLQIKMATKAFKDNDVFYLGSILAIVGIINFRLSHLEKIQAKQKMFDNYCKLLEKGNKFQIMNYEKQMSKMLNKNTVILSTKTKKTLADTFLKCLKIIFK